MRRQRERKTSREKTIRHESRGEKYELVQRDGSSDRLRNRETGKAVQGRTRR